MSFIRVVLGMAASMNLEVKQLDVMTVFLHGDLEEEIYMEQLEGFVQKGKENFVFKLKNDGKNLRYKAHLVVKGFGQKKCIDFVEIFSPVCKMSSIQVVLGMSASMNLEVEQFDVKTAFLHGDLKEEIYMEQP